MNNLTFQRTPGTTKEENPKTNVSKTVASKEVGLIKEKPKFTNEKKKVKEVLDSINKIREEHSHTLLYSVAIRLEDVLRDLNSLD